MLESQLAEWTERENTGRRHGDFNLSDAPDGFRDGRLTSLV